MNYNNNMDIYEKLGEALNVKLSDDYRGTPSLEIGTWNTADGYELHVICLLYTSPSPRDRG